MYGSICTNRKVKRNAYKGSGRAGVLQGAVTGHHLQDHLRLHTCNSFGVLVDKAVATRDGEDVLWSLHAHPSP